ncbi:hypothetical protein [uncultured Bosea sp.]|uniref:hypothetical protein n=1 Tax=uncultured Bosea sp. TaxID=211457 RepID=UPI0025F42A40|nr:hypothetical protein [uncultured Bosea sp.]
MGHLYQLKTAAKPGEIIVIGGPWDTYGKVLKHQASGFHLIRGLGHAKPIGRIIN